MTTDVDDAVNPLKPLRASNELLRDTILEECKKIVGSHGLIALCLYGPRVSELIEKSAFNVLIVAKGFKPNVTVSTTSLNEVHLSILTVDQEAFEGDVGRGSLGDLASEVLMGPYEPLVGEDYLRRMEVEAKRRVVKELLENVVLEFPDLSEELYIRPEYFIHEVALRKAQLSLFTHAFFSGTGRGTRVEAVLRGYEDALKELALEGLVKGHDGYFKMDRGFIQTVKRRKARASTFLRKLRRAFLSQALGFLPKVASLLIEEVPFVWEDPRKHLFLSTPLGLTSLYDQTPIEGFVKKFAPGWELVKVEPIGFGSILSPVRLLTIQRGYEERKVLVKNFKDWLGLKWLPLALWTLGTYPFAVLGESRLEREYVFNKFLRGKGINVPEVLYVSYEERLLFEEYVKGTSAVEALSKAPQLVEGALKGVGEELAKVHALGVTIGDCKPGNVLIAEGIRPYFIDLEQATVDGDKAWDIAEFLYYSGHYVSPISPADAERIASSFIEGYLSAGGDEKAVKKAGTARYAKVFSLFTLPHIILAMSKVCKKAKGAEAIY